MTVEGAGVEAVGYAVEVLGKKLGIEESFGVGGGGWARV